MVWDGGENDDDIITMWFYIVKIRTISGDNHLTMKRDEFVQQAAETFLHKVKSLK
jgi:hypothetical protein